MKTFSVIIEFQVDAETAEAALKRIEQTIESTEPQIEDEWDWHTVSVREAFGPKTEES